MSKHTPGPWNVSDIGLGFISKGSLQEGWEGMIAQADVGNYARGIEEGKANACLIAAAPELLEACKNALEHIVDCGANRSITLEEDLQQAIRKAENG